MGPTGAVPELTPEQAQRTIITNLPRVDHHGEIVEAVGPDTIRVRLPFKPEYLGAEPWQDGQGRVFLGPMVMGLADTTMYCCVMAAMGTGVIPVMANFNVTFLRPARERISSPRHASCGAAGGCITSSAGSVPTASRSPARTSRRPTGYPGRRLRRMVRLKAAPLQSLQAIAGSAE